MSTNRRQLLLAWQASSSVREQELMALVEGERAYQTAIQSELDEPSGAGYMDRLKILHKATAAGSYALYCVRDRGDRAFYRLLNEGIDP